LYYEDHAAAPEYLRQKEVFVQEAMRNIQPKVVWDIGANTGHFSRLVGKMGIQTIAIDGDYASVEQNYSVCKRENVECVLPLRVDICSPTPPTGWNNEERASLVRRGPADAVLALALIHHLAVARNIPLGKIAAFFAACGEWLIIEFVPKTDSNVQGMLHVREDIFESYTPDAFETEFKRYFRIHKSMDLQDSVRTLYLMKRRKKIVSI
jgi:ribosomal protein L11 methylase PrmA